MPIKKDKKKKLKSTCQTRDMSYDTKLTTYKVNHDKLWNLIFNKLNIKV
jgi:hypothetical protein